MIMSPMENPSVARWLVFFFIDRDEGELEPGVSTRDARGATAGTVYTEGSIGIGGVANNERTPAA